MLFRSYAGLHDWDSLWFFAYETTAAEFTTGFFDHGGHPGRMVNNLLAAALFRRGDVSPAIREFAMAFPPETEASLAATRGGAWSIADGSHLGVPASLALASRLSLRAGADAAGLTAAPAAPSGSVIESDTKELRWDSSLANRGAVTVNTPRTKALIGFTASRLFDLGGVVIAPGETRQDWSTIGVTLLEGDSFDGAGEARGLIIATGENANTGMVWKDASRTSVGSRWGSAPSLVEVVRASITLPVAARRLEAWVLNERGERGEALAVEEVDGKAQVSIGRNGATLWYELRINAESPN